MAAAAAAARSRWGLLFYYLFPQIHSYGLHNEEYIHSRIVLQYVALAYVRSLLNSTYVTLPLGTVSYCTVR